MLVCLRLLVNTPTELVTSYSIPIIRMSGHFHGLALANYDKAFRPTSYPGSSLRLPLSRERRAWERGCVPSRCCVAKCNRLALNERWAFHLPFSRLTRWVTTCFVPQQRKSLAEGRESLTSQFICRTWNQGRWSYVIAFPSYRNACKVAGCIRVRRGYIDHYHTTSI